MRSLLTREDGQRSHADIERRPLRTSPFAKLCCFVSSSPIYIETSLGGASCPPSLRSLPALATHLYVAVAVHRSIMAVRKIRKRRF